MITQPTEVEIAYLQSLDREGIGTSVDLFRRGGPTAEYTHRLVITCLLPIHAREALQLVSMAMAECDNLELLRESDAVLAPFAQDPGPVW